MEIDRIPTEPLYWRVRWAFERGIGLAARATSLTYRIPTIPIGYGAIHLRSIEPGIALLGKSCAEVMASATE